MKKLAEYFVESEQSLSEKAVSQQQQKFMGMVHAMQKGDKVKGASPELKKVAATMGKKDAEDFASTKHKGLPKKVDEVSLGDYMSKAQISRSAAEKKNWKIGGDADALAIAQRRTRGIERAKPRAEKARRTAADQARSAQLATDRDNIDQLRAQLSQLQSKFDPNYGYSDDHTFWSQQNALSGQIQGLKKRIKDALGEGQETMTKRNAVLEGIRAVNEARIIDEGGETFDHLLNRFKNEVKRFENGDDLDSDLYEALYDYYSDAGEIPYGIAKGRTGDPFEWVTQRLVQDLGLTEQMVPEAGPRPEEIPAFQRKAAGRDFPATVDQVFDTGDKLSHVDTLRKMAGLPPRTPSVIQPRNI